MIVDDHQSSILFRQGGIGGTRGGNMSTDSMKWKIVVG